MYPNTMHRIPFHSLRFKCLQNCLLTDELEIDCICLVPAQQRFTYEDKVQSN